MSDFELETMKEIWNNRDGSHIEIGPDRDGLGLAEIRAKGEDNKIFARVTMMPEEALLVAQAINELWGNK